MLASLLEVKLVKAIGTVYIRNDGSTEGTGLTFEDGVYVFTSDISGQIIIEKDGVIVDGSGYVLHGMNEGGIFLENRSGVVLRGIQVVDALFGITMLNGINNEITESNCHIQLENSFNNTIYGNERISLFFTNSSKNTVTGNNLSDKTGYGFKLQSTSNGNSVFGNNITDNIGGIEFHGNSNNNSIFENNIVGNGDGMIFYYSDNNLIYDNVIAFNGNSGIFLRGSSHNSFFRNDIVDNDEQVMCMWGTNIWDNGSEGNYWSDYNGTDNDGDCIGDEPHHIFTYQIETGADYDVDNYPLIEPLCAHMHQEDPTPLIELPWAAHDYFPEPNSIDVPLNTTLSISFGRPPSIVELSMSPEVVVKERTFEPVGVAGGLYTFHLSELLEPATTYSVTIVFGSEGAPEGFAPTSTRTWNFTTMAEATEPELEHDGIDFPIVEVTLAVLVIMVAFVVLGYTIYKRRMLKKPVPHPS
jgi:parallel beta-helix repeat protein